MGGIVGIDEPGRGHCGGEIWRYGSNSGISSFGRVVCGVGVCQCESFCEQFLLDPQASVLQKLSFLV